MSDDLYIAIELVVVQIVSKVVLKKRVVGRKTESTAGNSTFETIKVGNLHGLTPVIWNPSLDATVSKQCLLCWETESTAWHPTSKPGKFGMLRRLTLTNGRTAVNVDFSEKRRSALGTSSQDVIVGIDMSEERNVSRKTVSTV